MRERKSVTTASGTTVTESVWSGMQLLAERDSDGTTYAYVYGAGVPLELVVTPGPGLTGAGIAKRYAYQTDAGGSVIGITDASGAEIARYAYDPYGNLTATSGTDPIAARNPLRYRGYYYDAESGLYYLPARYYEPRSARFLSVDPAAPKAGDAATINAYSYCFADPVNDWDPTGADPPGKGIHRDGVESSWTTNGVTYHMKAGKGGHFSSHRDLRSAMKIVAIGDAFREAGKWCSKMWDKFNWSDRMPDRIQTLGDVDTAVQTGTTAVETLSVFDDIVDTTEADVDEGLQLYQQAKAAPQTDEGALMQIEIARRQEAIQMQAIPKIGSALEDHPAAMVPLLPAQ